MKITRLKSENEILDLIEYHNNNSESVVIDTETTSNEPRKAKLIDIQLEGKEPDEVVFIDPKLGTLLKLFSLSLPIIAHNYKYELQVLSRHSINMFEHKWLDTMLMGHLIDENRESYSLDSYVKELWNDSYKEEFWSKYKSYKEAPEAERELYAAKDIIYTRKLFSHVREGLRRDSIPDELVWHVHSLCTSLTETETRGISVDLKYLQEIGTKIRHRINTIEPEMRACAENEIDLIELDMWMKEKDKRKTPKGKQAVDKPEFNFESSKQLQELLYRKLDLPPQQNSVTKCISTDYDSLENIKNLHPIVNLIQENREIQKVYNSFIDGTIRRMDQGRVYPEFHVGRVVTGRTSSSNPNMQQLPRAGGVRGIYVPDPGFSIVSADYSSLEIVIAANFTDDPNLKRIVEQGESMHDITANSLKIDRNLAKSLNFAEGYGCSHYKVAKILGISLEEAQEIHNKYWRTYAGQKAKMDECKRLVDSGQPIITPWGRRRRFPNIKRNPWDKAYRQAWNFLIQSTGADCTNRAFYLFSKLLRETDRGKGWFVVHDEILAEIKDEYAEEETNRLCQIMQEVGDEIGLKLPLKAEPSEPAKRWLD